MKRQRMLETIRKQGDTPLDECPLEPRALEEEIDFVLTTTKNI